MKRLIVVDDDPRILETVSDLLSQADYMVVGKATTLETALELVATVKFDCAVLDIKLFEDEIAPVVTQLRLIGTPFVLITGVPPEEIDATWLRELPMVVKPFARADLLHAIEQAMEA